MKTILVIMARMTRRRSPRQLAIPLVVSTFFAAAMATNANNQARPGTKKFCVNGAYMVMHNPANSSLKSTVVPIAQNPLCLGQGTITLNKRGNETDWQLHCAGDQCPTGPKRCHPETSTNLHGGVREWCGCKGVPEPPECHVVKITPGNGEGGGPPSFACAGGCPVQGDVCNEHRDVQATFHNGKPKRITFHCECENPKDK